MIVLWTALIVLGVLLVFLIGVALYDLTQKQHAVLRNFPVVGHLRFIIQAFGPELRQYIVSSDEDERPFNRNERRWVSTSSKRGDTYFGFGTELNFETTKDHVLIKPVAFPLEPHSLPSKMPCGKVLGGARLRRKAFRPASVVNIAAMSFGSLSGAAVASLNGGARLAGCWQNTGEGGLSKYHQQGGDLVFQIGTGYFSVRTIDGRFDLARLTALCEENPVRAIEIKMSQGAKPGHGGILPGAKVTPEIAAVRGVEPGRDCLSPVRHSAFSDVSSLLDFVEMIADATGLPVGIKSAVGDPGFFIELASTMANTARGVDFVTVDGGEGGTGAAPLVFADHVALPFRPAFAEVYRAFFDAGVADDVVFIGSAKLGLPGNAQLAFAMGADLVGVAREAMLAMGCIQAQRCHTGRCPSGVATQSAWLARGLDPELKSVRVANYIAALRSEVGSLAAVCGVPHPALVRLDQIDLLSSQVPQRADHVFSYEEGMGRLSPRLEAELLAELAR